VLYKAKIEEEKKSRGAAIAKEREESERVMRERMKAEVTIKPIKPICTYT
jgi:hypothetical protein